MNEYNERILKNILQDEREEKDKELLKEIEEAANNPMFQLKEGEAEKFANENFKKAKTKPSKIWFRVASVLLILAIGVTVIPFSVEGRKNTLAELIINYVNSEFFAVDNEDPLLAFEGKYAPTWIPDGYEVDSITNTNEKKEIILKDSDGHIITYRELSSDVKINIDSQNSANTTNIEINGLKAKHIQENNTQQILINADNSIIYIASNDVESDLLGFAKLIEKR